MLGFILDVIPLSFISKSMSKHALDFESRIIFYNITLIVYIYYYVYLYLLCKHTQVFGYPQGVQVYLSICHSQCIPIFVYILIVLWLFI